MNKVGITSVCHDNRYIRTCRLESFALMMKNKRFSFGLRYCSNSWPKNSRLNLRGKVLS